LPDFALDRPSWDAVWMEASHNIARRSLCSRAQVGAVIVASDQTVLSMSYNGPPPGYEVSGTCGNWCPRARGEGTLDNTYDTCPSAHAEANGVSRLDRSRVRGATVYVNRSMCFGCAKLVSAAGVSRVVHRVTEDDLHRDPDGVEEFLRQCGVSVERWSN
jgi:dCMP deaminase